MLIYGVRANKSEKFGSGKAGKVGETLKVYINISSVVEFQ